MSLKQFLVDNIKNSIGWKTNRKIVVFSVDDYGNIRLDSKQARASLDKAGLKIYSRFDAFDTLETTQDLEALFEALTSVRDKHRNYAVFTPFALPCNIDFEKMQQEDYEEYYYELLPVTYEKLSLKDTNAYGNTWKLWKEGMAKGLMAPQFHGREHFNLKVFKEKLKKRDKEILTVLKNRSYTSIRNTGYSSISITAAFEFWKFEENNDFHEILIDGLNRFEEVYGYKAIHFNPPGGREHPIIHKALKDKGIQYLDTPFIKQEHQGEGNYKKVLNYTGKRNELGMTYQVRNVVFEPTDNRNVDWVAYSFKQIEAAFRWHKPAIISSHRVNFCGHIDENNRKIGIKALRELLKRIVTKWPDVEFMSASELGNLITKNKG